MQVDERLKTARRALDDVRFRTLDVLALERRGRRRRARSRASVAVAVCALAAGMAVGVGRLGDRGDHGIDVMTDVEASTTIAAIPPPREAGATTTTAPFFEPIYSDLTPVEDFVRLSVVNLPSEGTPDPGWDRIHYEQSHEAWGPGPIAVDEHGTLWIPDNVARRIVRIDAMGQPIEPVALPGWEDMASVQALVVDRTGLYALDTSNVIVHLSHSGTVLDRHPVPVDLTLVGGLPAILSGPLHLDDDGRVVIDAANRFLSFDPADESFTTVAEILIHGTRFRPGPPAIEIQGRRVGRVEPGRHTEGGRLVGISPDGFVVVSGARTGERPDGTPEWQEWLWRYHREDERAGQHQIDPRGRFVSVLHPAAVGPDGRIYLMNPRAEEVTVTVIG